jgi:hypothetical protein
MLHRLEIGIQAIQLSPYHAGPAAPRFIRLNTTAAFLACYCSLHLSDPGKPSDPETTLQVPPNCVGNTTRRLVAHIPPLGVLAGQAQHRLMDGTHRRRRPCRFGFDRAACRRRMRSRCQRSTVSGRTSSRIRRSASGVRRCSRAVGNALSVGVNRTLVLPFWRSRTASWCRSAKISASLSRSLIGRRRRTANVFVTVRYASRNNTADYYGGGDRVPAPHFRRNQPSRHVVGRCHERSQLSPARM